MARDGERFGLEPGGIAKFEGGPVVAWQVGDEFGEALSIGVPAGWELVEEWTQLLAEPFGSSKKSIDAFLGIFELFHVGDVAAGFDGEEEAGVRCGLFGPGVKLVI